MRPTGAATNGVATQEPRPWIAARRRGSVVDLSVACRELTSTTEARGLTTCWPSAESVDASVRKRIPGTFMAYDFTPGAANPQALPVLTSTANPPRYSRVASSAEKCGVSSLARRMR